MKFSEMPYERPELEGVKRAYAALTARLASAGDYAQARAAFLEKEALDRRVRTQSALARVRASIDTRDAFYEGEMHFWNGAGPELRACTQAWTEEMMASPFREAFASEFGELMFINAELEAKTFSPTIVGDMQRENEMTQEYENLLASAQIPFEGGVYTISQLAPFKNDPDDARRLAAWQAEGLWYTENQPRLDSLYDELVHLRDAMGRKLGYENYLPMGYCRMARNCYGPEEVERFRAAVRRYVVPLAEDIYRAQAKRLGKSYPMSFADNQMEFRSGNPKPQGGPEDIVAAAREFYRELSPETGAFFQTMLDGELMSLLSTRGKRGGGFCTSLPDYGVPFIFANFNGTMHDVEVVTHEAGHAFASWLNRDRVPASSVWPSLEACEVHSMSMEFMAWPWEERFFGPDARKFYYSHLAGALTFIPYGTMVDHFQHICYEQPDLTPAQRHGVWRELMGQYTPWHRLDGEIPCWSEGRHWQRQHHIYSSPLYYIDYCLAQTVALELWALLQEDKEAAWERYLAYTRQGGSQTFTGLLQNAGLDSPFDGSCLKDVCEKAAKWLADYDLAGIR